MALTSSKPRNFLAVPTIDQRLPVKASAVIYAGALLMYSAGAVTPLSGAGVFAGVALESKTGGAADGTEDVNVRVLGGLDVAITTDTPAITAVGVAATIPEATDDDTIRVETGASITGTAIGKFLSVIEPGVAGGRVGILFKGASVY